MTVNQLCSLDWPDIEYHENRLSYYTITIKQIVRFQERMHFEKIQLDQVQNGRQSAIIHFHMADIW